MKITTYRSKVNPDRGFSINEQFEKKVDPRDGIRILKIKTYSVWVDNYEGGEAYESDWEYIDTFKSFEIAYEYITTTYGEVEKIDVYE